MWTKLTVNSGVSLQRNSNARVSISSCGSVPNDPRHDTVTCTVTSQRLPMIGTCLNHKRYGHVRTFSGVLCVLPDMYDGAAKQIGALVHAGAYHQTAVASALNDQPIDTYTQPNLWRCRTPIQFLLCRIAGYGRACRVH